MTRSRTLAAAALMILTTACTTPPSGANVQPADFPMGVPVVPVSINGINTKCVLDVGDTSVWLSPTWGGEPASQFNPGSNVLVDSLVFAGWNFGGFEALTAGPEVFTELEGSLDYSDQGVECILGNTILGALTFTVDWNGGWVEASDPEARQTRPEGITGEEIRMNLLEDEVLYVGDAKIDDDLRGIMMLSTAQPRTMLLPTAFDDLDNPPALTEQGSGVSHATFSSIAIEGLVVTDVPGEVRDDEYLRLVADYISLPVDGIIGTSVLAAGAVTFDIPKGELVIRPYEDDVRDAVLAEVRRGM